MMRPLLLCLVATGVLITSPPAAVAQPAPETQRIAVVIPVASDALFTSDGRPARDAADRLTSLADALMPLTRPELADVPIALAPSPLFCDEATRFGGPVAARLTELVRDLAARMPVLSGPHASVLLPHLPTPRAVADEIEAGRSALENCTRQQPRDLLVPPDLMLDRDSLAGAVAAGTTATLASSDQLPSGATRFADVTLVPAHPVRVSEAPNDALVPLANEDVSALLVDPLRPDLDTFVTALANDPRVEIQPVADLGAEPVSRFVSFSRVDEPPASYRAALSTARAALDRFRSYTLRDNRLAAILATAVGRARSTSAWEDDWTVGVRRARAVTATVDRQEGLISAAEGSVTFTSRRGSVPVTVTNGATYPVRVRVGLASSKLSFPDGASRIVTVDPPGDTTVFVALARSTGTFPVQARVTSLDGGIVFHSGELTVRSTAANLSALILTAGGALFLIGWAGRQLRRRRRAREAAE